MTTMCNERKADYILAAEAAEAAKFYCAWAFPCRIARPDGAELLTQR